MQNQKSTKHKKRQDWQADSTNETEAEIRARLERLCECDRILSESEIADFADISKFDTDEEDVAVNSEDCDEELVTERLKLSHLLDLPEDTHSLTKIETNLPPCLKYGFRSGLTHLNMRKFSPLTRGHQVRKKNKESILTYNSALFTEKLSNTFLVSKGFGNRSSSDRHVVSCKTTLLERAGDRSSDRRRRYLLQRFICTN